MKPMSFKKSALPVLALLAVLAMNPAAAVSAGGDDVPLSLTKAQLDQAMHDYIASHPELIMNTVNDFLRKQQEEKQMAAVKEHHDELYRNDNSPFIGDKEGDVTLIEFFDYNCHYCKNVFPELKSLSERDKRVKIVFKDYPILGPTSGTAAKWALAAQVQGKYFQFHSALMELQGALTDEAIERVAKSVGLDIDKAKKDLESEEILKQIDSNRALAQKMGFTGTPAFVIGEKAFSGILDHAQLDAAVLEMRQKSAKH